MGVYDGPMPAPVLILSSHVSVAEVGGGAQAAILNRLDRETILVPTVLLGRHPGHGPPGGGAVDAAMFESVLEGVRATGIFERLGGLITGYFASAEQVAAAARAIDAVRAVNASALILIDPIMGDDGRGLYVSATVAEAIARELVPRAGLLAPYVWELARLTGLEVRGPESAVAAARALERPAVVSSVTRNGEIGAVYADATQAWLAAHSKFAGDPKGAGDRLTARLADAWLDGDTPADALLFAVRDVARSLGADGDVRLEALA
jgi:pyridoxine kinase